MNDSRNCFRTTSSMLFCLHFQSNGTSYTEANDTVHSILQQEQPIHIHTQANVFIFLTQTDHVEPLKTQFLLYYFKMKNNSVRVT